MLFACFCIASKKSQEPCSSTDAKPSVEGPQRTLVIKNLDVHGLGRLESSQRDLRSVEREGGVCGDDEINFVASDEGTGPSKGHVFVKRPCSASKETVFHIETTVPAPTQTTKRLDHDIVSPTLLVDSSSFCRGR